MGQVGELPQWFTGLARVGKNEMREANEPAFPSIDIREEFDDHSGHYRKVMVPMGGLTKREYFAIMALQGMVSNSIPGDHHVPTICVMEAVALADLLLAELEKGGGSR